MERMTLDKQHVYDLVRDNHYRIETKRSFISRCVDGRYAKINNLPPLAFPGADIGELAVIFSAANSYGFEVDQKKALESLISLIGGAENFQFHTDDHSDKTILAGGCGYVKQFRLDPLAFDLKKDQVSFIDTALKTLTKKGARQTILKGRHIEEAVVRLQGNYSLYPRFILETDGGRSEIEVFVYHATLANLRHKALAKKLLEHGAVKFFPGCDEEYLYQALSEVTETHLFEILKRLATGLPIYLVRFDEAGGFTVEDEGRVL